MTLTVLVNVLYLILLLIAIYFYYKNKKSPIKGILICLNDVSIKVIHLTLADYYSFEK